MNNTIAAAEEEVMKSTLLTQHDFDTCDLASLIFLMIERHDTAIAAAVLAERTRCAKVAEEERLHTPVVSAAWLVGSNDRDEQVAFTHADHIAAAIQARSEVTK